MAEYLQIAPHKLIFRFEQGTSSTATITLQASLKMLQCMSIPRQTMARSAAPQESAAPPVPPAPLPPPAARLPCSHLRLLPPAEPHG